MRLKRASAQKSGIQEKIGKKGTQQRRGAALVTGCRHKQPEGLNWFSLPSPQKGNNNNKNKWQGRQHIYENCQ